MKKRTTKRLTLALLAGGILLATPGCEDNSLNNGGGGDSADNETYAAILVNYVDRTVLPTYEALKEEAVKLNEAVEAFKDDPTQVNLEKACAQWKTTRIPWEQSEAFLFGPVANQQIDPHLDSWPLNQTNINAILAGNIAWTNAQGEQVEDGSSMGAATLGFHTLEYLLFENGAPRRAETILARSDKNNYLWYMVVVSQVLRNDALCVYALWAGSDNLTGEDAERANELEFPDLTTAGYAARFKNPNVYDQAYPNQQAALYAIIDGCVDIATEVADAKIGEPYNGGDVYGVESWYSFNSFDDYDDNIESIENAYLGGPEGNRDPETSLYTYCKSVNATAAEKVVTLIEEAHNTLTSMPDCFRNLVLAKSNGTRSPEVEAAMETIGELSTALKALKPLIQ